MYSYLRPECVSSSLCLSSCLFSICSGDLAKEDASDRLAACQRLLQGLQSEQKSFLASGGDKHAAKVVKDEDEDDDDEDGPTGSTLAPTVLPTNLCASLSYALKRLTRGLASSRAGARQGFALALTEILAHMPVVQTEDVLAIVADQVKLSSKANKQVGRGHTIYIFSYSSLSSSSYSP
jgi:DNA polymerase phi